MTLCDRVWQVAKPNLEAGMPVSNTLPIRGPLGDLAAGWETHQYFPGDKHDGPAQTVLYGSAVSIVPALSGARLFPIFW